MPESRCPAHIGFCMPATPQSSPSTDALGSLVGARRCPPGKRCLRPAPRRNPPLGNARGPRPSSVLTPGRFPGSQLGCWPVRWPRESPELVSGR